MDTNDKANEPVNELEVFPGAFATEEPPAAGEPSVAPEATERPAEGTESEAPAPAAEDADPADPAAQVADSAAQAAPATPEEPEVNPCFLLSCYVRSSRHHASTPVLCW